MQRVILNWLARWFRCYWRWSARLGRCALMWWGNPLCPQIPQIHADSRPKKVKTGFPMKILICGNLRNLRMLLFLLLMLLAVPLTPHLIISCASPPPRPSKPPKNLPALLQTCGPSLQFNPPPTLRPITRGAMTATVESVGVTCEWEFQ